MEFLYKVDRKYMRELAAENKNSHHPVIPIYFKQR
jgi:hypothetical protein